MKTRLLLLLALAATMPAATFQVFVDTTGLNAQSGTIDIQFNPGSFPGPYEAGSAVISAFSLGGGSLGAIASGPDGGASGTLAGQLTLLNTDFLNGVVYNATFGTTATFNVDFTGNAFTMPGQSILTTLSVAFNGTTSLTAVADLVGGGVIDTSFSNPEVSFSDVPEPGTFGLLAMGLAAGALAIRKRK